MLHQDFTLETSDGLSLFGRIRKPEKELKGVVVLIHGLGEHIGRYEHVSDVLAKSGYCLIGTDLRGHGRSPGLKGHFPGYDQVLDDIHRLVQYARNQFPSLPVFIYGHSLGGALTLYYLLKREPDLAGAIVSSPGLVPGEPPSVLKLTLARMMNSLWPTFSLKNDLDLDNLSHNPEVKQAYVSDPLVHSMISARLGWDLLTKGQWMMENASKLQKPLLLMQGSADHMVDPEVNIQFARSLPSGMVTFKLWEGYYHEIHNEPGNNDVFLFMINWLDKITSN